MKPETSGRLPAGVNLEKVLPHPPERVWQALTDPQALAQWLLPTTFQPQKGHRFRFTRLTEEGRRESARCQVVELDAPRRLAYTWQADNEDAPSLVTWTLEAVGEGTRLRLEHTAPETACASLIENSRAFVNNLADSLAVFLSAGGLTTGRFARRVSARRQRAMPYSEGIYSVAATLKPRSARHSVRYNSVHNKEASPCAR